MKSRHNGTAVDALPSDAHRGGTPFDDLGLAVSCREPLSHHMWLGIGGEAGYFCEPVDVDALSRLVSRCHAQRIPLRVIGGGSNILVPSAGFAGLVVRLSAPAFSSIQVERPMLRAGAGRALGPGDARGHPWHGWRGARGQCRRSRRRHRRVRAGGERDAARRHDRDPHWGEAGIRVAVEQSRRLHHHRLQTGTRRGRS